jgi:hypothetical protein
MSQSLVFASPTHTAKASICAKAAGTVLPAKESRQTERQSEDESRPQWSFADIALEAPEKIGRQPGRAAASARLRQDGGILPQDNSRGLPGAVRRALDSSAGERLPEPVAAAFSRKFGSDLRGVTIYRDGVASEAARSIGANAFARGSDLYFRAGAFQPDSLSGQALLAHELAHVVEQTQSPAASSANHSPGRSSVQVARSEAYAQSAAQHHIAGRASLSAGPPVPVSIAADNGVSYEDEDAKVSVLATEDDAAEKVADMQAEADRARAAAGGTDAAVAAKDEKAQKLREAVQVSVAKKQAQNAKGKKGGKGKSKGKTPAPAGPNSSPDLRDASPADVEAHQHELEKAMALTPDVNDRLVIAREQENTQASAEAADRREQYKRFKAQASSLRSDIDTLKGDVTRAHELRESTSSWVTGPTHFWGGAWNEIEGPEFAGTYSSLYQAEQAAKAGRFEDANALLQNSWDQWWDLNHRFEEYAEGIQRGGNRVVTGIKLIERVNRGMASLNPVVGFVYNFGQDSFQQHIEVGYGQRKSVEWWGNLKNSAVNTAVNVVAAGGSNLAGEAAAPYLANLGPYAGLGKLGVEQATGILISSGLTGTSPIDTLEDPAFYVVPFLAGGYAHGGGDGEIARVSEETNSAPPTEAPALGENLQGEAALTPAGTPQLADASAVADTTASPENLSRIDAASDEGATHGRLTGAETDAVKSTPVADDSPVQTDENAAEKESYFDDWSDVNRELGLANPVSSANETGEAQPTPKPARSEEPVHRINDLNKSKGVLGEAAVPFGPYSDPAWNHIGGGSETASSRENLARQSSHDEQMGQEGTAGTDFLVENVETGRLVIGEQKATQGESFTDATAITTSLESNIARDIEVLQNKIESGTIKEPVEVARLQKTVDRLNETLYALQSGRAGKKYAQLPEGVVFELTNVGGEGKQIGKQHIDLLAEKYGKNPEFLEHLLDRTAVRDPELAKSKGRDSEGKRGTDADPDIVPAKDILTPKAKDTLERLRAGKTKKQWEAAKKAQHEQRAAAESAALEQARQAGEKARQERLKELQDERAQKNEPESRIKRERDQAARKLEREAKEAGKRAEKVEVEKFLEARERQEADAEAALDAQRKAKQEANRQKWEAERKANEQDAAKSESKKNKAKNKVEKPAEGKKPAADQQNIEAAQKASQQEKAENESKKTGGANAEADKPAQGSQQEADAVAARRAQEIAQQEAARQKLEAAQNANEQGKAQNEANKQTEANKQNDANQTETGQKPTEPTTPEAAKKPNENATNEHGAQPHGGALGKATHAANQAAGAIRGYDAYEEARAKGQGRARAALSAGLTYFENTNPVAGAASTAVQRMQKDDKGEQYYGNDAGDAWLGTIGETGAGYVVPGAGWDQAVNAAGNLTDAVDDHMQRGRDPKAPANNKATLRTGADLAVDLTPSREFAQVIGGGARAYYDLGRAAGGDTSGVDKFAEDATRGKLGSVIQPWAMAADFAGNLGNSTVSQALEKTVRKTEGTTLKKIGDASGDAMYNLGQSKEAKAGKYGTAVQGISDMLSISSDTIAGKSFDKALNEAADAGKGSLADTVGSAMGDAAFKTVEKGRELVNEDLPAAKKKAGEVIDRSKEKLSNWWKQL